MESYVPNAKNSVDTTRDTWLDIFIPPSQTLISKWYITGRMWFIYSD
jgi:hypothetical protein